MKTKHLIVAVLALAILGTVVVSSCIDENEADSLNETRYQIDVLNGSEAIDLVINENYFDKISSQYEVVWAYSTDSIVDYRTIALDTKYSCGGNHFTFVIKEKTGGNKGEYVLTVTDTTDSTMKDELRLKCIVKGTVTAGDGSTSEYEVEPAYMIVKISLKAVQLPEVSTYTVTQNGKTESMSAGGITITEKSHAELVPSFKDSSIRASDYVWYATGLPNGLAMTGSGNIVGIPTAKNYTLTEATVYVSDINGNTASYSIYIVVMEQTVHDLSFYLYNGELTEKSDAGDLVYEPSQFLTERGKTVTLAIVQDNITVSYLSNSDGKKIVAKTTGDVKVGLYTYHCYTLPTDGTGMYRIVMSNADGEKLDAFDLYVLSGIVTVQSGIIVGSSGSS